MKKATHTDVQKFMAQSKETNEDHFHILQNLREIVFDVHPKASEEIKYGGILFSKDSEFGGIFAYKNHVSFEFSQGVQMKDPEKILEGGGQFRRHIKLSSLSDIESKQVAFFVKQIQ
jgi:hypothetical protein